MENGSQMKSKNISNISVGLQDATKIAEIALIWLDIGCVLQVMKNTLLMLKNNLLSEVVF